MVGAAGLWVPLAAAQAMNAAPVAAERPVAATPPRAAAGVTPGDSPVGNAERTALRIETLSLDMHLNADTGAVITRARLKARNGGAAPLGRVALQVSSALLWQSARLVAPDGAATTLPVEQYRVTTDTDHTGAANELMVALSKPLAPGAEMSLDLYYGGTLRPSAERLLRLGAPETRAAEADWDRVSSDFVGLRGFGNVLWFPVSAPAAILADGDTFAKAVSEERERSAGTTVQLSLTLEHTGGSLARAWFLDQPVSLTSPLHRREAAADAQAVSSAPVDSLAQDVGQGDPEQSELATAKWDGIRLDGRPVSLFVAGGDAVPEGTGSAQIRMVGGDTDARERYRSAVDRVRPLLKQWLPSRGGAALTMLALPSPGTQAFADGDLLVTPVRAGDVAALAESLVYPMAAAAVPVDAPAWMRQGVPEFLRLMYLERTGGRDRMLAELQAISPALQQAEAERGLDPVPLRSCVDPVCARDKAAYALLMLRGLVGEAALEQALQATLLPQEGGAAGMDAGTETGRAMTRRFEAALQQSAGKDMAWFFADWFSADRGLPDLQIVQVAPRRIERGAATVTEPTKRGPRLGSMGTEPQAEPDDPRRTSPTAASRNTAGLPDGSWLVAVEVQNNGDAAVEVPVTVRSSGLQNQLPLRVPAHGRATVRVPFEAAPEEVWVNDGTAPEQHGQTHHRSIEVARETR